MLVNGCFINGRWVETKERLCITNPWSWEVVGEVSLAGPGEWEAAVSAGQEATSILRWMSSQERLLAPVDPGREVTAWES